MFELKGKIVTIHKVSDKVSQIILKKQVKGKQVLISVALFGYWKDKMESLKLMKNDKIKGMLFLKSNFYKEKWYTDVYFQEVEKIQPKSKSSKNEEEQELFGDGGIGNNFIIDEETGEILL